MEKKSGMSEGPVRLEIGPDILGEGTRGPVVGVIVGLRGEVSMSCLCIGESYPREVVTPYQFDKFQIERARQRGIILENKNRGERVLYTFKEEDHDGRLVFEPFGHLP